MSLSSLSTSANSCETGLLSVEVLLAVAEELSLLDVALLSDEEPWLWIIVRSCKIWLLTSALPVPVRAVSVLLELSDEDVPSRSETRLLEELVSVVDDVDDVLLSLLNNAASKELAPLDDPMPLVDMEVSFNSAPPNIS